MTGAVAALIAREALPQAYEEIVERYWRPLAALLARRRAEAGRPILVGINGAQGSGKSTLTAFLAETLLPDLGLRTAALSLDDFYLPKTERRRLARDIHPLFQTRGVPGTHDMPLLARTLDRIMAGAELSVPRFAKHLDDRLPAGEWTTVTGPAEIVLLEGWCVGVQPQNEAALADPVNMLEAREDGEGRWRRAVNQALAGDYRQVFARLDLLVMLRPPDFDCVLANRLLQERKLRNRRGGGGEVMDDAAVVHFVQHYERLTRHMFDTLPDAADVLIDLDSRQQVMWIRMRPADR